jgi:tripeptidyl-peptidase-1
VGATQGPEEGGNPEVVCAATNNNTFITTGGGFSAHFATPSYQSSAVQGYLSNTMSSFGAGFNAKGRGYPDVALIGHLYPIFVGGEQEVKDGTSASTPVMAAIISLVNAKRLALKKPTVGFANPALYKWAGEASIFHDITSGSNECTALGGGGLGTLPVCCPHSGFRAEKGWDAATGLGSVNVGNLIEAWAAL